MGNEAKQETEHRNRKTENGNEDDADCVIEHNIEHNGCNMKQNRKKGKRNTENEEQKTENEKQKTENGKPKRG